MCKTTPLSPMSTIAHIWIASSTSQICKREAVVEVTQGSFFIGA